MLSYNVGVYRSIRFEFGLTITIVVEITFLESLISLILVKINKVGIGHDIPKRFFKEARQVHHDNLQIVDKTPSHLRLCK